MKILKVVDLSHPVDDKTQVYPGDPKVNFSVHSTIERDGFNLLTIELGSQSGTHVDAPFHFDNATEKIDELSLERFLGRGIVVNLLGIGPRVEITWEMIRDQLTDAKPNDIVLIHTGFDKNWQSDQYFNNPYLSAGACREILSLGVRVIGIDAMNLDETPDETHPGVGFPCHHLIAEVAGVICENLTNLDAIDFANPIISLLPMRLTGADGAPVRAVAIQFER